MFSTTKVFQNENCPKIVKNSEVEISVFWGDKNDEKYIVGGEKLK